MAELLLKYGIILNDTVVRFVARFKTLAALEQLNPSRRTFLIQSLLEAQLITYNDQLPSASLYPIIELSMANLTGIDLSLIGETTFIPNSDRCPAFDSAILNNASFHRAQIDGATFVNTKLDYADFSFSYTGFKTWCYNRSTGIKYVVTFKDAHMHYVNFYKARLSDIEFIFADMTGANMSNTEFFGETNFAHAKLKESYWYMAQFRQTYRNISSQFYYVDLTGINGTQATFSKCMFSDATLVNCILKNAIFNQTRFLRANMTNCQLINTQLANIIFDGAIMNNVDMTNMVCLEKCSFYKANLTGVILHNAMIMFSNLLYSKFTDEQLAQTRSLAGSTLPNGTVVPMTS